MSFDSYMKNLRRIEVASVKYTCSCKRTSNLEELFFCGQKGCRQFLCQSCTEQVIDTYYCPSCLNSFFSSTAFQNTNKCQQCRKCPTCFCTLGHMTLEDETFIFHCEYCKWRSDSVGLVADQIKGLFAKCKAHETQSDGDEKESPKKYFDGLLENYGGKFQENLKRNNAFFEEDGMKLEKKEPIERFEPTGDVRVAMERIDELLANKQKGLLRLPKEDVENTFASSGGESKMSDKDFNINSVSSLEQRFSNPSFFPRAPDVLWPYGENLQTKVGHKCTKCTRFVLKPKAGATKVSHDIANLAIDLFPRATLKDYPKLETGKKQTIVVVLKNPVPEEKVSISFGEIPDEFNEGDAIVVVVEGGKNIAGTIANKKLWKEGMYAVVDDEQKKTALYPKEAVKVAPPVPKGDDDEDEDKEDDEDEKPLEDTPLSVDYKGRQTATVVIPKGEVTLDPYDEISEHNESLVEGKANPDDDKNVVAFRMLSRVGFNFVVTPTVKEGDVVFSFVVNVKPNSGSKVLTFQEFQFQATVNLGPVNVETKKET